MRSRAEAMGHAIHPMLIVFPLGLLSTAVVFDVLYLITNRTGFQIAAAYAIAAGLIGGVVAAVFGLVDWMGIPPGTRAKRIGRIHAGTNLVAMLLFAVSWLLRARADNWDPSASALVASFAGLVVASIGGWLGGELVERLGVGVDPEADVNTPSSLSHGSTGGRSPLATR
jgi:uncharacterized membrane protein